MSEPDGENRVKIRPVEVGIIGIVKERDADATW